LHAVAKVTYRGEASVSQPTDRNHGSQLTSFVAPRVSPEQVDQGPPLDIQLNVTYFIQRR